MNSKKFVIIWLHGLGASGDDMQGLAEALQLQNENFEHVFLTAKSIPVTINQGYVMPAWYDITGATLTDREDESGILASEKIIIDAISAQLNKGYKPENIILAGFSQGGAMALHTGLRYKEKLGGVIALSCYLPLSETLNKSLPDTNKQTPIFSASGSADDVVNPKWSEESVALLQKQKFENIESQSYPMGHNVIIEELQDVKQWLNNLL